MQIIQNPSDPAFSGATSPFRVGARRAEGFRLPDKSEYAPQLSGAGVSSGVGVAVGCDALS